MSFIAAASTLDRSLSSIAASATEGPVLARETSALEKGVLLGAMAAFSNMTGTAAQDMLSALR